MGEIWLAGETHLSPVNLCRIAIGIPDDVYISVRVVGMYGFCNIFDSNHKILKVKRQKG